MMGFWSEVAVDCEMACDTCPTVPTGPVAVDLKSKLPRLLREAGAHFGQEHDEPST